MYESFATLLEAFVMREISRTGFCAFRVAFRMAYFIRPYPSHPETSVRDYDASVDPPASLSASSSCDQTNQAPSTNLNLKQPPQCSPRTKAAQAPQSLLVVSTEHSFSIT